MAAVEDRVADLQARIADGEAARLEREQLVVELREEGRTMLAIAALVGISDVAVLKILRRHNAT